MQRCWASLLRAARHDLEAKLRAFGWHVSRVDGHDVPALERTFRSLDAVTDRPKVIVADTVKGKGVSFMENVAGEPFDEAACLSPLPRAYQWVDGSAYLNHVRLVRRARGAEPPPTLETDPLVYQGGSGVLLGPTDDVPLPDHEHVRHLEQLGASDPRAQRIGGGFANLGTVPSGRESRGEPRVLAGGDAVGPGVPQEEPPARAGRRGSRPLSRPPYCRPRRRCCPLHRRLPHRRATAPTRRGSR